MTSDNLHLQHLTSVYLALHISGGQIGLPIVVFTASICRRVNWHPTIMNFCVTWIVYSIVYCLYLYVGAGGDFNQHFKLCAIQASLIHGAAPMAVVAGLAIVLHTWTTLQSLHCTVFSRVPRMLYITLMLGTPYLVLIIFSVGAGAHVMSQPQSVCSNGLYCTLLLDRASNIVVPSFCAAIMVIILGLEAAITVQYYRQWKIIKTSFPLATRTPSRSVYFRVGLFCLYSCVTLTSTILFVSDKKAAVTYMLPAALPLGALVVLGLREGISIWTSIVHGPKHSSSSFEMGMPSARAASRSDATLTPTRDLEESPREPGEPV